MAEGGTSLGRRGIEFEMSVSHLKRDDEWIYESEVQERGQGLRCVFGSG